MTKRCTVCDITDTTGLTLSHTSQHEYPTEQELKKYHKSLVFYTEDDGTTTCSECFEMINNTLREMEAEDEI